MSNSPAPGFSVAQIPLRPRLAPRPLGLITDHIAPFPNRLLSQIERIRPAEGGIMSEEQEYAALDRFASLPEAVLAVRGQYGADAVAFEDIEGNRLTLGRFSHVLTIV